MVLEGGRLIASAPVAEDGTWKVTHPHDWKPGTYTVEFVSVFSAIHSRPARLTLRVHGVPEGNWIRQSVSARAASLRRLRPPPVQRGPLTVRPTATAPRNSRPGTASGTRTGPAHPAGCAGPDP